MRKLLAIVALLTLTAPAWGTSSIVQHVISSGNCNATGNTCNLTITTPAAGNLGYMALGSGLATDTLSSVSGNGSWTVPGSSACVGSDSAGKVTACAYNLSLTASTTTMTVTRSSSTSTVWRVYFCEIHTDLAGGSFILDTNAGAIGNRDQSTNSTSPAGVALTLNGSNDVLIQAICATTPTAINGAYTTSDFVASFGYGIAINTNTGTAPTWTTGNGKAGLTGIGFTETSGANGHCNGCELSQIQPPQASISRGPIAQ